METIICTDCAAECIPSGCGTGYATLHGSEKKICYSCSDKRQRTDLIDRSKPFTAYVSGDGQNITSWTGGKLMKVTNRRSCELTRQSLTHDRKEYSSFRAVDCHGRNWFGRGSPGICITMRPTKN